MRAAALVALALAATRAYAVDTPTWPPPQPVQERMHALQQVIIDPGSTLGEREAARAELANLLKSPAGQARGPTPEEKGERPARAAIIPFPSVVKPLPPATPSAVPSSEIAHIEITEPPKPIAIPGRGTAAVPTTPTPGFALDPATGHTLHAVPGGYVDPRTGAFIPH